MAVFPPDPDEPGYGEPDYELESEGELHADYSAEQLAESFVNGNINAVLDELVSSKHNYNLALDVRQALREQFGQDTERFTQNLISKLFERIP